MQNKNEADQGWDGAREKMMALYESSDLQESQEEEACRVSVHLPGAIITHVNLTGSIAGVVESLEEPIGKRLLICLDEPLETMIGVKFNYIVVLAKYVTQAGCHYTGVKRK